MAASQLALAKAQRVPSTHMVEKVPAFLAKLNEMVNDPKTNDLIVWSEAGDSFFVLDHDHFAKEVLPRWFKHSNWSSFVRQLNMYGFHKIPHLQQGVLKSETDTEFWNFAHPNFRRDQTDLLCLIQRKKGGQAADEDQVEHTTTAPAIAGAPATGQVLDIQSIVNGVAAIKRHQTTISAELNELKRSNQLLWQDAMAARARHQKQQDTINRIVKFLAGVFGQHSSPVHKEDVENSPKPRSVVVPRLQGRLLIEDGRRDGGGVHGRGISEINDKDSLFFERDQSPISTASTPFASIETPVSMTSPSIVASEPPTPSGNDNPLFSPLATSSTLPVDSSTAETAHRSDIVSSQPQYPQPPRDQYSLTPSRSPDFEPVLNVLAGLSRDQIQQLMSSLSFQNPEAEHPDLTQPQQRPPSPSLSSLLSYHQPFDMNQFSSSYPLLSSAPSPAHAPETSETPASFVPSSPSLDRLSTSWKATSDIAQDVDAIDSKINNLIHTWGLDPNILAPNGAAAPNPAAPPTHPAEFEDLESLFANATSAFMNDTPPANAVPGVHYAMDEDVPSAFLDEVPPPPPPPGSDGTASPATLTTPAFPDGLDEPMVAAAAAPPKAAVPTKGRKRKNDIIPAASKEGGEHTLTKGIENSGGNGTNAKKRKR